MLIRNLKAITVGTAFIIFAILLAQLIFIMVIVGYNELAKDYSFLNDIAGSFRYLIGIPFFLCIMFIGGYITGYITGKVAQTNVLLNCLIVGMITVGISMWMALENASLTSTGLLVNILMLAATLAGGLYMNKQTK